MWVVRLGTATSISSAKPTTTTRSASSSRVTTSSTSAKSTSVAVSTSTMTRSQTSSTRSTTSSSASSSNSITLAIPASATAATDGSDDGLKMSSGIVCRCVFCFRIRGVWVCADRDASNPSFQIAAIAVVSALVALALALVGYRYYKRRSRRNARRVSGLNAWASHRQSENVGGWNGGDDTWRKAEESGDGVGRWEGEKEMVSPVSRVCSVGST